jgi:hypothetical protein
MGGCNDRTLVTPHPPGEIGFGRDCLFGASRGDTPARALMRRAKPGKLGWAGLRFGRSPPASWDGFCCAATAGSLAHLSWGRN